MKIYTAFVLPAYPADYYVTTDWATVAIAHNEKMLGQELCVITGESPGYQAMHAAAAKYDNISWRFGTLVNYVALREFAESDGPSDELFVWLEADMIVNPLYDDRSWLDLRGVYAIYQQEHLLTIHEHFKRDFAIDQLGIQPIEWTQVLSTMVILERAEIVDLLNSLHSAGYDIYTEDGWDKLASSYDQEKYPNQRFFCDQVIEFAYILSGRKPKTIKDLVGWVSYNPDYATKPIIHFDGHNKTRLPEWLASNATS